MANINLSKTSFDIPCPQCGEKTPASGSALTQNDDVILTCHSGHKFTVENKEFVNEIRAAEKALKGLSNTNFKI